MRFWKLYWGKTAWQVYGTDKKEKGNLFKTLGIQKMEEILLQGAGRQAYNGGKQNAGPGAGFKRQTKTSKKESKSHEVFQ